MSTKGTIDPLTQNYKWPPDPPAQENSSTFNVFKQATGDYYKSFTPDLAFPELQKSISLHLSGGYPQGPWCDCHACKTRYAYNSISDDSLAARSAQHTITDPLAMEIAKRITNKKNKQPPGESIYLHPHGAAGVATGTYKPQSADCPCSLCQATFHAPSATEKNEMFGFKNSPDDLPAQQRVATEQMNNPSLNLDTSKFRHDLAGILRAAADALRLNLITKDQAEWAYNTAINCEKDINTPGILLAGAEAATARFEIAKRQLLTNPIVAQLFREQQQQQQQKDSIITMGASFKKPNVYYTEIGQQEKYQDLKSFSAYTHSGSIREPEIGRAHV